MHESCHTFICMKNESCHSDHHLYEPLPLSYIYIYIYEYKYMFVTYVRTHRLGSYHEFHPESSIGSFPTKTSYQYFCCNLEIIQISGFLSAIPRTETSRFMFATWTIMFMLHTCAWIMCANMNHAQESCTGRCVWLPSHVWIVKVSNHWELTCVHPRTNTHA